MSTCPICRQEKPEGSQYCESCAKIIWTFDVAMDDINSRLPRMAHYILDKNGEPTKCSYGEWICWKTHNRTGAILRQEKVGRFAVSTVLLPFDWNPASRVPIIWETMVFRDGGCADLQDRCGGSREQAEAMHERMCERVAKAEGVELNHGKK